MIYANADINDYGIQQNAYAFSKYSSDAYATASIANVGSEASITIAANAHADALSTGVTVSGATYQYGGNAYADANIEDGITQVAGAQNPTAKLVNNGTIDIGANASVIAYNRSRCRSRHQRQRDRAICLDAG